MARGTKGAQATNDLNGRIVGDARFIESGEDLRADLRKGEMLSVTVRSSRTCAANPLVEPSYLLVILPARH
jgi:hypothetical protein